MATEKRSDLQIRNTPDDTEHTRTGPVYTPAVDIFETDQAITVLADMPGVKADDLVIDLRDNVLSLTGRVKLATDAGQSVVLDEFAVGTFFRRFALSEAIDQAKIDAKLTAGVLRLELPKAEKAKPRQVTVRAG